MVANTAEAVSTRPDAGAFARFADRWIYVFMAALFVVATLVGFIPDSVGLLARVDAGRHPPLTPILHVHAVVMASWLALLLVQTTLVAAGRRANHQTLGLIGVVLAPVAVAVMIGVAMGMWSNIASAPPRIPPEVVNGIKSGLSKLLLEQIRVVILFAGLVGWALVARRRDPETHKRLMILATLMPIVFATDRITWLPAIDLRPTSSQLYALALLLPALIYDVARRGRIHRAYVIGIALNLPFVLAEHLLWDSPWWLATAPRLMGGRG